MREKGREFAFESIKIMYFFHYNRFPSVGEAKLIYIKNLFINNILLTDKKRIIS